MSQIPPTAFFSTFLACAKACSCVTASPFASSSFSLSTTIRAKREVLRQSQAVRASLLGLIHHSSTDLKQKYAAESNGLEALAHRMSSAAKLGALRSGHGADSSSAVSVAEVLPMFLKSAGADLLLTSYGVGPRTLVAHGGWVGSGEPWLAPFERLSQSWCCDHFRTARHGFLPGRRCAEDRLMRSRRRVDGSDGGARGRTARAQPIHRACHR